MLNIAAPAHGTEIRKYNNFDTIRAIAAFLVLVSHSFPISYGDNSIEPLFALTNGQTTLGELSVAIFFVISGFLISRSFVVNSAKCGGYALFIRARILRIMPAFSAALLLLAFVAGPFITNESIVTYVKDSSIFKFIFFNAAFIGFYDRLPGVFEHNPFKYSIDGSLWTLRHEVRCYVFVFFLGVCGLLRREVLLLVGALIAPLMLTGEHAYWFLYESFVAGSIIYFLGAAYDYRIAISCIFVVIIGSAIGFFTITMSTFGAYAVIYCATSPKVKLPNLAKYGDFSYGIYIYAFPVQQIIQQFLGSNGSWWLNVAVAAPITLMLAIFSWFVIERPALALKRAPAAVASSKRGVHEAS